jgi:hypothetical protein
MSLPLTLRDTPVGYFASDSTLWPQAEKATADRRAIAIKKNRFVIQKPSIQGEVSKI